MQNTPKFLIIIGLTLAAVGAIIWGLGLGNLPGDIQVQREKGSFYFPITTSIIVSIIFTILLNLFFWLKK